MAIQYPVPQLTPEELLYLREKNLSVASATLDDSGAIILRDTSQTFPRGKIYSDSSLELAIWKLLLSETSPHNHTMPAKFIQFSESKSALALYSNRSSAKLLLSEQTDSLPSLKSILDFVSQMLEGVQFMHENGMPHGNLHSLTFFGHTINVVASPGSSPPTEAGSSSTRLYTYYIHDFKQCAKILEPFLPNTTDLRLPLESVKAQLHRKGSPIAIAFGEDVQSIGDMLETYLNARKRERWMRKKGPSSLPPSLWLFAEALRGNTTHKLTVKQAAMLFRMLQAWLHMTRWTYRLLPKYKANLIDIYGWNVIVHVVVWGHMKEKRLFQAGFRKMMKCIRLRLSPPNVFKRYVVKGLAFPAPMDLALMLCSLLYIAFYLGQQYGTTSIVEIT